MINQADLGTQYLALKTEIDAALSRVLASGQYVGGPEVTALESEFAAFCGAAHAVAVSSGTDALRFVLMAAGVGERARKAAVGPAAGGPGAAVGADEVITSPMTFIATTEAISQAGARPVFVDIDPISFNLDPARVEAAMTPRTRAIVPVHLYGQTADMDPILALARRRGVAVIEDACQAHGALYKGRPAGALADAAGFSFYPTKNLGACGEGGIAVTASPEIALRVRHLRDHGQAEKYWHVEEGYNGRLDAMQAAILRVKLKRLAGWNERRRALAERYREALRDLVGRSALRSLPSEMPWARHAFHLYPVRIEGREKIRAGLREQGIDTGIHYPVPLHLQAAYAGMGLGPGSFPHAEKAANEVVTLPLYPELADEQVDRIASILRGLLAGR
ncbi:MAG TPA: DegT/DnrJ/EryC1/StrS family aminotransferase [Candidatus Polarisedimenticolia bacterium]